MAKIRVVYLDQGIMCGAAWLKDEIPDADREKALMHSAKYMHDVFRVK